MSCSRRRPCWAFNSSTLVAVAVAVAVAAAACVAVAACSFDFTPGGLGNGQASPNATNCASPPSGFTNCACTIPHGTLTSCLYSCVTSCDTGWAECDQDGGCTANVGADPNNCGTCGAQCDGACVDGACRPAAETLAGGVYLPQGIAADGTNVYWMADGVLHASPVDGKPPRVLAQGEYTEGGITLDNGYVYWSTRGRDLTTNTLTSSGQVRRVPVAGGAVETLSVGLNPEVGIVAHDGVAYLIDDRPDAGLVLFSTANGGTTRAGPSGGGNSVALLGDSVAFVGSGGVYADAPDAGAPRVVVAAPSASGPLAASDAGIFLFGAGQYSGHENVLASVDGVAGILATLSNASVLAALADGATLYVSRASRMTTAVASSRRARALERPCCSRSTPSLGA